MPVGKVYMYVCKKRGGEGKEGENKGEKGDRRGGEDSIYECIYHTLLILVLKGDGQ